MFDGFGDRFRQRMLSRLRPGRDEDELLALIGNAEAVQSDEHRRMLENLVVFRDVRVRELMVPRSEIFALEKSMKLDAAVQAVAGTDFSKLPVYDGDLDHIIGMIHAWDVFAASIRSEKKALTEFLSPCLNAPESELVLGLLSRMKRAGVHIAVVTDEYGGTGGLVTLSDLLTEIVGSMDEASESIPSEAFVRQPDGSLMVHGRMHVEELEEQLHLQLPDGDYDTVGGLITSLCGRIPRRGERLELAGLCIDILEAEPRRVLRLRVSLPAHSIDR
ncbi:MAG: hemolysin family protein [Mariprofundaceae bacterium]